MAPSRGACCAGGLAQPPQVKHRADDMPDEPFVPLSHRSEPGKTDAYQALYSGVPAWLKSTLDTWITRRFKPSRGIEPDDALLRRSERVLRITLDRSGRYPGYAALTSLLTQVRASDTLALNVVDMLLHQYVDPHADSPREIRTAFVEAGSEW